MSKKVELSLKCSQCSMAFKANLYRSIWIEEPENMELIQHDKINRVRCPRCDFSQMLPLTFLATNVKKRVAVWYEPIRDTDVDSDAALYSQHFGENSFYAKAPRINDWDEFKKRLKILNEQPDVPYMPEDLSEIKRGMQSIYAERKAANQPSIIHRSIVWLSTWRYRYSLGNL